MEKGLKKVFSAMGAVFCAVMMIMLCQVTNAVSYSEQTVTVDYDYQVIDSFEGVDAKYYFFGVIHINTVAVAYF